MAKHNERNPGKEVVYLNYAAVDPALTNEKCDYWHFRLDADTSMKMEALTSFMKDQPKVRRSTCSTRTTRTASRSPSTSRTASRASAPT